MSAVRDALVLAFGKAVQAGVQGFAQQQAAPKKKRSARGCQPCEAQKHADKVMREVRGK